MKKRASTPIDPSKRPEDGALAAGYELGVELAAALRRGQIPEASTRAARWGYGTVGFRRMLTAADNLGAQATGALREVRVLREAGLLEAFRTGYLGGLVVGLEAAHGASPPLSASEAEALGAFVGQHLVYNEPWPRSTPPAALAAEALALIPRYLDARSIAVAAIGMRQPEAYHRGIVRGVSEGVEIYLAHSGRGHLRALPAPAAANDGASPPPPARRRRKLVLRRVKNPGGPQLVAMADLEEATADEGAALEAQARALSGRRGVSLPAGAPLFELALAWPPGADPEDVGAARVLGASALTDASRGHGLELSVAVSPAGEAADVARRLVVSAVREARVQGRQGVARTLRARPSTEALRAVLGAEGFVADGQGVWSLAIGGRALRARRR